MSGSIQINGIKVHAYHGCMKEEEIIGTRFVVDVEAFMDLSAAASSDDLDETVDYVTVSRLVVEEMAIRSKLIESVAVRILNRLKEEFPIADSFTVSVTKIAPPSGGLIEDVTVTVEG